MYLLNKAYACQNRHISPHTQNTATENPRAATYLAEGAPGCIQHQQRVLVPSTTSQLLNSSLVQGSNSRGIRPEVALCLALFCGAVRLLDVTTVQAALLGCRAGRYQGGDLSRGLPGARDDSLNYTQNYTQIAAKRKTCSLGLLSHTVFSGGATFIDRSALIETSTK